MTRQARSEGKEAPMSRVRRIGIANEGNAAEHSKINSSTLQPGICPKPAARFPTFVKIRTRLTLLPPCPSFNQDIVFWVDVWLNFTSAFSHGAHVVHDKMEIIKHYMVGNPLTQNTGWFWVDLIGGIPFELIAGGYALSSRHPCLSDPFLSTTFVLVFVP